MGKLDLGVGIFQLEVGEFNLTHDPLTHSINARGILVRLLVNLLLAYDNCLLFFVNAQLYVQNYYLFIHLYPSHHLGSEQLKIHCCIHFCCGRPGCFCKFNCCFS